jgi:hypothetical protein
MKNEFNAKKYVSNIKRNIAIRDIVNLMLKYDITFQDFIDELKRSKK